VVGFISLHSEGLTNLLAVGNDAPNWLQSLIFGRGHGEYFAELSRIAKVRGGDSG
jgi:hypothetical protein